MNEELNIETTRNDENEVTVVMDAITDRSQVINRLQEIVSDISLANKTELEHLKQGFYKLLHTEQEAKKADYVANGGNIEEYVSEKDELEEQYKQLMKIIKEKRAAQQEALEIIRKENLKKTCYKEKKNAAHYLFYRALLLTRLIIPLVDIFFTRHFLFFF